MSRDPMDRGYVSVPVGNDQGIEAFMHDEAVYAEGEDGQPSLLFDPFAMDMKILTIRGPMALVAEVAGLIERAARAEIAREESSDETGEGQGLSDREGEVREPSPGDDSGSEPDTDPGEDERVPL